MNIDRKRLLFIKGSITSLSQIIFPLSSVINIMEDASKSYWGIFESAIEKKKKFVANIGDEFILKSKTPEGEKCFLLVQILPPLTFEAVHSDIAGIPDGGIWTSEKQVDGFFESEKIVNNTQTPNFAGVVVKRK